MHAKTKVFRTDVAAREKLTKLWGVDKRSELSLLGLNCSPEMILQVYRMQGGSVPLADTDKEESQIEKMFEYRFT